MEDSIIDATGPRAENGTPVWFVVDSSSRGDTVFLETSTGKIVNDPIAKPQVCAQDTKVIPMTVWDWANWAPAFSTAAGQGCGLTTGLVRDTLVNGLPKGTGLDAGSWKGVSCRTKDQPPEAWFQDDPRNSRTCIELPLTRSMATGDVYQYDNQTFFPVDSLANQTGKQWEMAEDGRSHDFRFCMKGHSAFTYTPGQTFQFKGDDDVWIFVNNKLVVDLGGTHVAATTVVSMDNQGLVSGNVYPFDMFYCERAPKSSTIRIQTSLNFEPAVSWSYRADKSRPTALVDRYDLRAERSTATPATCGGSGVASRLGPAHGMFSLIGPSGSGFFLPIGADTTAWCADGSCGLAILGDSAVLLDTARIQSLGRFAVPGTYTFRIQFRRDPTRIIDIPFQLGNGPTDHVAILFDRDGDGHADSASLVPGKAPVSDRNHAGVFWWNQAGTGLEEIVLDPSRIMDLGTRLSATWSTAVALRTGCPDINCQLPLGTADWGTVWSHIPGSPYQVRNPIVMVVDAMAPVALSARLSFSLDPAGPDTLVVRTSEPVKAGADTLFAYSETSQPGPGTGLSRAGIPTQVLDSGRTIVQLLPPSLSGLLHAGQVIRLRAGVSDSLGNVPGATSRWVPLEVVNRGIAWLLDKNNDGRPDSVGWVLRSPAVAASQVRVAWNQRDGTPDTSAASFGMVGAKLDRDFDRGATFCAFANGCRVFFADGFSIPLLDSLPPMPDSAALHNTLVLGGLDTLWIWTSEAVLATNPLNGKALVVATGTPSAQPWGTPLLSNDTSFVNGRRLIRIAVPATHSIVPGDSVRMRGSDSNGALPGRTAPWVPIVQSPKGFGILFDVDGDGRPDSLAVIGNVQLAKAKSVKVRWSRKNGLDDSIEISSVTGDTSGIRQNLSASIGNLEQGATSCRRSEGCSVQIRFASENWNLPLLDSVPPVADHAVLRNGDDGAPDTLDVWAANEGMQPPVSGSWLLLGNSRDNHSPSGPTSLLGDMRHIRMILDKSERVRSGDSVRLTGEADSGFARVGKRSRWVPVSVTPKGWASLHDRDGDGKPDSVSVVSNAILDGLRSMTLRWSRRDGTDDSTTFAPMPMTSWEQGWALPGVSNTLSQGATACRRTNGCTLVMKTDSVVFAMALRDSVPPVADSAVLRFGASGTSDTLDVWVVGEGMIPPANGVWLRIGSKAMPRDLEGNASLIGAANRIRILVDSNAIVATDSVRLRGESDSGGARVGVLSKWVPVRSLVRGEAFLMDRDFDGGADSVVLSVRGDMGPFDRAVVRWTEGASGTREATISGFGATNAKREVGFALPTAFPKGATACTRVSGCEIVLTGPGGSTAIMSLSDRVAAVAVRASLRFARSTTDPDTLDVHVSESVKSRQSNAPAFQWGRNSDAKIRVDIVPLAMKAASDTEFVLLLPNGSAPPRWLDSLRIRPQSDLVDTFRNQPGDGDSWVPVGLGPRPGRAVLTDRDGDGRAEHVEVAPLRADISYPSVATWFFTWNGPEGVGRETRSSTTLTWDTARKVWSGDLDAPFSYGATSCPQDDCRGSIVTKAGDTMPILEILDGLPPVIVSAKLRYGPLELGRDTLVVRLSEPWANPDADSSNLGQAIVRVGSATAGRDLSPMTSWSLSADHRTLRIVIDSTIAIWRGDHIQLTGDSLARTRDSAGNRPGSIRPWIPIEFGTRPQRLMVNTYPSVRISGGKWIIPTDKPALSLLVRNKDGGWSSIGPSGEILALDQDTAHLGGILLHLNGKLEGRVVIYDNMGVYTNSIGFEAQNRLWDAQNKLPPADRVLDWKGEMQVWIAWNHRTSTGSVAASGIYLWRVIGRLTLPENTLPYVYNQVWKYGWGN